MNGKDYLQHHGILGQRKGARNGPPYPLSASSHSSREKSHGTKGWSSDAKKESKQKTLFKKHKKASDDDNSKNKKTSMAEETKRLNDEATYYKALKNNIDAKNAWAQSRQQGKSALSKAMEEAVAEVAKDTMVKVGKKVVNNALKNTKNGKQEKAYKNAADLAKYHQNKYLIEFYKNKYIDEKAKNENNENK